MAIRVLVVDDSSFFRRQIQKLLADDSELEVIDTAANGQEAVDKALKLRPDVITMDIEMPEMNGIQATRQIMRQQPTPILMFSSLTTEGAKATLDALDAGALDFIPKRFEDISRNLDEVQRVLCEKIKTIGKHRHLGKTGAPAAGIAIGSSNPQASANRAHKIKLVAIGTSTGGPVALQKVLVGLPADFPVPVLVIQHMPGTFTPAFANRLNQQCRVQVKEAENGEKLKPGVVYLAPGGKQMRVKKMGSDTVLQIEDSAPSLTYKPSVDITFKSLASVYGNAVLGIILTGMGADGCEGSRILKQKGSQIWSQDKASSVIYGMPAAVAEAGISDRVLPLSDFASQLIQQV